MHLVFVSSLVPLAEPKSGYDIANRVIADALIDAGVELAIVGHTLPGSRPAHPDRTVHLGELEVTTASAGLLQKLRWLGTAYARRLTFAAAKLRTEENGGVLAALDRLAPFDGLVLNSVQLSGAYLEHLTTHPFVFVAHNVESRSAGENAGRARGLVERRLFRREAALLRHVEAELCRKAQFVWTLTQEDRSVLCGDQPECSAVLPLVTSLAPPEPAGKADKIFDIGLIGSWTWQPNRIGLDWFVEEVVPRLAPDISIAVAGGLAAPPASAHPGLRVLGRVPDARDFARSCRVMALASRAGTGVQLKTIETFELGLPSVATSSALRGIAAVPENCRVADDAAAFAAALTEIVAEARDGRLKDKDGRDFHAGQLAGLRAALEQGLAAMPGAAR